MNSDYENVKGSGLPPVTTFPIKKGEDSEACEEYSKLNESILTSCRELPVSWSLTLCRRGHYQKASKVTVLIVHDTIPPNWVTPNTGSLKVELLRGEFWR